MCAPTARSRASPHAPSPCWSAPMMASSCSRRAPDAFSVDGGRGTSLATSPCAPMPAGRSRSSRSTSTPAASTPCHRTNPMGLRRILLAALALCAAGTPAAPLHAQASQGQPGARPAAAPGAIRLLVRADDMGAAQSVDSATIDAYRNGVVRSAEVIVPGPWFLDAVRLLKANPGLDVGVHLALTSEWERV